MTFRASGRAGVFCASQEGRAGGPAKAGKPCVRLVPLEMPPRLTDTAKGKAALTPGPTPVTRPGDNQR